MHKSDWQVRWLIGEGAADAQTPITGLPLSNFPLTHSLSLFHSCTLHFWLGTLVRCGYNELNLRKEKIVSCVSPLCTTTFVQESAMSRSRLFNYWMKFWSRKTYSNCFIYNFRKVSYSVIITRTKRPKLVFSRCIELYLPNYKSDIIIFQGNYIMKMKFVSLWQAVTCPSKFFTFCLQIKKEKLK